LFLKIILLGPPGAGKGTQSRFISEHFNIPIIATGDMLRSCIAKQSPLGLKMKSKIDEGRLIPDADIIALVEERISSPDCADGFLLDGFPRTVTQAKALEKSGIICHYVVYLDAPDTVLTERAEGRWIHPGSGRVYHQRFHPPQAAGLDDLTGEPLVHRPDDNKAVIAKRLAIFRKQTGPVVSYYKDHSDTNIHFKEINGLENIETVKAQLMALLDKK
jgi:adenylate kinase